MSYIPLGPLHPGIKEPLRIKLKTEGERVVDAEVDLGFMYRGAEQIARGKPWQSEERKRSEIAMVEKP